MENNSVLYSVKDGICDIVWNQPEKLNPMNTATIQGLTEAFTKAGEEGWKSIIPFYNNYILYKIVWDTKFFFISLGLILGMWLCMIGASFSAIFTMLYLACLIAGAVIGIMCDYKLSKSFGHGAGFTVGLIFLGIIFYPILGFGRSPYLGNNR